MRLAVTAGYARSLHAIALIHRLVAQGHEVALALEVRVLTPARLLFYWRQLGWQRLWSRARGRLLTGLGRSGPPDEITPLLEYARAHQILSRTVSRACRQTGARHVKVSSLNAPRALAALRDLRPDLVVYAGGGLLRRDFIDIPRRGVLNAHGGPLPAFRGMNVAEWALLHGVRPIVAVHYVDRGIDTGPVLLRRPIPDEAWRSIPYARGVAARVSVEALLEAVQRIEEDDIEPRPQRVEAGRQYFVMADPLLEVLARWIAQRRTPVIDPGEFAFPAAATPGGPGSPHAVS